MLAAMIFTHFCPLQWEFPTAMWWTVGVLFAVGVSTEVARQERLKNL